ncbi:hypothetical protein VTK56DRAFT_2063 [Thermocarpiscus australiensis]
MPVAPRGRRVAQAPAASARLHTGAPAAADGADSMNIPGPSPTSLLSRKRQQRGFNPEWQETITERGMFKYSLMLRNVVFTNNTEYRTPEAGKRETVTMALNDAYLWDRIDADWNRTRRNDRNQPAPMTASTGERSDRAERQSRPAQPSPNARPSQGAVAQWEEGMSRRHASDNRSSAERARQEAATNPLDQLCRAAGIQMSEMSRSNPEAVRGFLRGLAVATSLLESTSSARRSRSRSRSRSPAARPRESGQYRERSPARARSGSPPRYGPFRSRRTDSYRPDYSGAHPRRR